MSKRKIARMGETPTSYRCTKQKCKWEGTLDQQAKVKNKDGYSENCVCPNCGNVEFFGLL